MGEVFILGIEKMGKASVFPHAEARTVVVAVAQGNVTRKRNYSPLKLLVIQKGGAMLIKCGQYQWQEKIRPYKIPGQVCIRNTWKGVLEKISFFLWTNETGSRAPVLVAL